MKQYSPMIVRYGLAAVFLIFGIMQWTNPSSWFGYLPPFAQGFASPTLLIIANGTFDALLGAFLALGLFTRVVSAVAFLHLCGIITFLGWNDVAVRDIGLAIVAAGVFLHGKDDWSLDKKLRYSWL